MITAIDTNVLLDYLNPAEVHNEQATQWLLEAGEAGPLVISPATYAELAAAFESVDDLGAVLDTIGIVVPPFDEAALFLASRAWLLYTQRRRDGIDCPACGTSHTVICTRCGRGLSPRQHILADFLIGAHAQMYADRLLTRDRSYYQTYFPDLRLA